MEARARGAEHPARAGRRQLRRQHGRARQNRIQKRLLRLSRQQSGGAQGCEPDHQARRDRGGDGRYRLRQDLAGRTDSEVLRRDLRQRAGGRRGRARVQSGAPARQDRRRASEERAVQRVHRREHLMGQARRGHCRDPVGGEGGAGGRLRAVHARRLRHPRGRARHQPVRRPEAARVHRPRHSEKRRDPDL